MTTRPAKLGVGKETPESPHDTHKSSLASKIQQKASFANLLVTPQVLMKNCSFRQRYYKISPLTYELNTQRPLRYIFTPPIKGGGGGGRLICWWDKVYWFAGWLQPFQLDGFSQRGAGGSNCTTAREIYQ